MPKNGHFGVLPPLTPTPLVPAGQQAMLSAMLLTVTSRRYVLLLLQPATSANCAQKVTCADLAWSVGLQLKAAADGCLRCRG